MNEATAAQPDKRAREALLESLAISRGGANVRGLVVAVCTLPAIVILGMPALVAWLAALLLWNAVLIRPLERHWVMPVVDTDLRAARLRRASMVLFGFTLTQGLPIAAWSTNTTFGAALAAAWVVSSATQLFIYYSRDRWLLIAGIVPVLACAAIGPAMTTGWSAESLAASLFVLIALAGGAAFVARSDALIAAAADQSAARHAAEAANHAKTRFIAGVHHELRTPLNAIIGYSELMLEGARDEGRAADMEDHERVLAAARLQLALMSDLLTFSELQDGRVQLEFEEFDAAALAREAVHALRADIAANGNTIAVSAGGDLSGARNDPSKIRQCLEQLLTNAAKFTRDGAVTLHAHREHDADGEWLVFVVADTGIGIAPERQAKIFEPLAHASESGVRAGGAGVGLAITARLARLLGGGVSVESAPGHGAAFTLRVRADMSGPQANEARAA